MLTIILSHKALEDLKMNKVIKCSDCGIEGIHACLGKKLTLDDLPKGVLLTDSLSTEYPLCGLELTVEQKIWRAANQRVIKNETNQR